MVMKSFVSELTGVNMKALGVVSIADPSWGEYHIETNTDDGDDMVFVVRDSKGEQKCSEWATIEGATACVELLEGGYWKG